MRMVRESRNNFLIPEREKKRGVYPPPTCFFLHSLLFFSSIRLLIRPSRSSSTRAANPTQLFNSLATRQKRIPGPAATRKVYKHILVVVAEADGGDEDVLSAKTLGPA